MQNLRLDLHVSQHCVDILFSIAFKFIFLATIDPEFYFARLIEAPRAVQCQICTVFVGDLRTQDHETAPRIELCGGHLVSSKIFEGARPQFEVSFFCATIFML